MYLVVGQLATEALKPKAIVPVAIPEAKGLPPTLTYAGQLSPGHQLPMKLGNAKAVAAAAMPYFVSKIQAIAQQELRKAEEARAELELQLESAKAKAGELSTSTGRAKPFVEYASKMGGSGYGVQRKAEADRQLTKTEINEVVRAAHAALNKNGKVVSKERIRDYIRKGEADDATLLWLAKNVSPVFAEPLQCAELNRKLQQLAESSSSSAYNFQGLEQLIAEPAAAAVTAIKSGNQYSGTVKVAGLELSVYQVVHKTLSKAVGVKPAPLFLGTIAEVREGRSGKGALVVPEYKTLNGANALELLPTQKFTQFITVFDRALAQVMQAYNPEVNPGLLIRALMPENPAMLTLYHDERVGVRDKSESAKGAAAKAAEHFESGLMAKIAAERLGLGEEELSPESLRRLVSVQDLITPLLPMDIYRFVTLELRYAAVHEEIGKLKSVLPPNGNVPMPVNSRYNSLVSQNNNLVHILRARDQALRQQFGVDTKAMREVDRQIVEEAISRFGEELGFVRKMPAESAEVA